MESELYTDNRLSCWYPELGPIAGYAVTCTYGLPDPTFKAPLWMFEAGCGCHRSFLSSSFHQSLRTKWTVRWQHDFVNARGAIGAVSNVSRDIHEIRLMGFQYMTPYLRRTWSASCARGSGAGQY